MTADEATAFALSLPKAVEDHPFGDTPDVYRVEGSIFALLMPDSDHPRISLKCDPELALVLRAQYESVIPGYHLNKKHWNTVDLAGSVPDDELRDMIRHSYDRVVSKMPKAIREPLLKALKYVV